MSETGIVPTELEDEHRFECRPAHLKKPKMTQWIWADHLPLGEVVLFAGETGTGKTTMLHDLVARITTGRGFPFGGVNGLGEPKSVMIINGEDSVEKNQVPRLMAAGADLTKVDFPEEDLVTSFHTSLNGPRRVGWAEEIVDLFLQASGIDLAAANNPNLKLVVIDPVTAFLGTRNANNNGEVKAFITRLQKIAIKRDICLVLITHLNKNKELMEEGDRVIGSVAWRHGPRMVFLTKKHKKEDPEENTKVTLIADKSNISRQAPSVEYEMVGTIIKGEEGEDIPTVKVEWETVVVPMRIKDRRSRDRDEVKDWIWVMCVVECPGKDLAESAEKRGFAYHRMIMAVKDLVEEGKLIKRREGREFHYSRAVECLPVGPVDPVKPTMLDSEGEDEDEGYLHQEGDEGS